MLAKETGVADMELSGSKTSELWSEQVRPSRALEQSQGVGTGPMCPKQRATSYRELAQLIELDFRLSESPTISSGTGVLVSSEHVHEMPGAWFHV